MEPSQSVSPTEDSNKLVAALLLSRLANREDPSPSLAPISTTEPV